MTNVLVGIHVHEQPEGLRATLESLRPDVAAGRCALLVLPDGPDGPTSAVLGAAPAVRQDATHEPRGAAACFNRLARASAADVVVLVESGAVAGPGWLERLLAALGADPRNGLAGPSTNLAWNAQSVAEARGGGGAAQVAATAALVAERYGDELRDLAPLHSLADFCFAVTRPVLDAVGAADEGFGLGPCWEMEYSARAMRAGYRAVWACGAYVHRAPFTPRRRREEAVRFEASKRRYQDAVCGLRLRRERTGYEPHCRGDACEHFAPAGLLRIHRPLGEVVAAPAPAVAAVTVTRPDRPARGPLVSAIMPTCNRAGFALQAVRYFQRQDHENAELIVVDDGDDGLRDRLPADPRVRYLRAPPGESIGAKRNRACRAAHGDFVVHWDDDDWYAPDRLRRQLAPLLAGDADVSALRAGVFFELDAWAFWRCHPDLHRALFTEDVHGGTLAYRRSLWEDVRFPAASLAEDALFLRKAVRRGARLARLENDGTHVYVRHGANAWRFACGTYLDSGGWIVASEPPLPPEDRAFYAARSASAPGRRRTLVSAIMPTADRPAFVERAIRYFQRQDHPARELLILDDGRARVGHLIPDDPRIRYVELDRRHVLGAKRNLGCELARGDVIVHWDDDDWAAAHRLSYQLGQLEAEGADVCGTDRLLYLDPARGAAWLYAYPAGRRPWLTGNTLCFTRDAWRRSPFPEIAVGEDTRFLWGAARRLHALADHRFMVGIVHDANASAKHTGDPWWEPVALADVTRILGADAAGYEQHAGGPLAVAVSG